MNTEIHTGRCMCGRVTYKLEGKPIWVCHCHCHSCRTSTGAPVTTFVGFKRDQVIAFDDTRKFYESSPGVRRGFCDHCGTPVSYEADRCADELHFYVSTMQDPDRYVPGSHVFYDDRIAWMELNDALPRYTNFGRGEPHSWGPLHRK